MQKQKTFVPVFSDLPCIGARNSGSFPLLLRKVEADDARASGPTPEKGGTVDGWSVGFGCQKVDLVEITSVVDYS